MWNWLFNRYVAFCVTLFSLTYVTSLIDAKLGISLGNLNDKLSADPLILQQITADSFLLSIAL